MVSENLDPLFKNIIEVETTLEREGIDSIMIPIVIREIDLDRIGNMIMVMHIVNVMSA